MKKTSQKFISNQASNIDTSQLKYYS